MNVTTEMTADHLKVVFEHEGKSSTQRIAITKDKDTAALRAACALSSAREKLTGHRWLTDADIETGRHLVKKVIKCVS